MEMEKHYAHSKENEPEDKWQPLKEHLAGVSEFAAEFAGKFGASDYANAAGLLHDAGKYSREFQSRLRGGKKLVDHSTAGAVVAKERFGLPGLVMAYVIAGHHAGLPDWLKEGSDSSLSVRLGLKDICDYSAFHKEISLPSQIAGLPLKMTQATIPSYSSLLGYTLAHKLFNSIRVKKAVDTPVRRSPITV